MNVASSGAGSHRSATDGDSGARSDMSHAVPGSQSPRRGMSPRPAVRMFYAIALIAPGLDTGAPLDDINEAETTLEEIERTARRVLGGAHPTTTEIEKAIELLRLLRANEKVVAVTA